MSKLRLNGNATTDAIVKMKLIWNDVLGRAEGVTTQNRKEEIMINACIITRIAGWSPALRYTTNIEITFATKKNAPPTVVNFGDLIMLIMKHPIEQKTK